MFHLKVELLELILSTERAKKLNIKTGNLHLKDL